MELEGPSSAATKEAAPARLSGERPVFRPHLILCPTDFSNTATYALGVALDIARQNHATLLVLHVADTLGPEHATFGEVATERQPEAHVRHLREQLERQLPPDVGVPLCFLLREGDPGAAISEVVRTEGCDLVVAGTHGRTGLQHLLMGSIAERIVRLAPCPVLVLKYPHRT
jgi:nucleotide-binding universal stress UspA family protein